MAIDPFCGMNVDEATARSAERDEQTFYFCGEHCRQKFIAEDTPDTAPHDGHEYAQDERSSPITQKGGAAKYVCLSLDPYMRGRLQRPPIRSPAHA